jgi:hypothetical protein
VCSLPVDGCLNVALDHATIGLWHDAHEAPKWLAGALWQDAQALEDGWLAAHDTPGLLWHVAHDTVRL